MAEYSVAIALKADASEVYTTGQLYKKDEIDSQISGKASTSDLDLKADTSDIYTRTYLNDALALKADTSDLDSKADAAEYTAAIALKADASEVYTTGQLYKKDEIDSQISGKASTSDLDLKADTSDIYTRIYLNDALALKANTSDLDSKADTAEYTAAIALKADASQVYTTGQLYTQTETNSLLDEKFGSADIYTRTYLNEQLDLKANASNIYTRTHLNDALALKADSSALDLKADASALDSKADAAEYTAAIALKANSAEIYTQGQLYRQDEINASISTGTLAVSGPSVLSGTLTVVSDSLKISNTTLVSTATSARTITLPDADGTVVFTSNASGKISSTDIEDGAITAAKIADGSITPDILSGSIGNGTSGQVLTSNGSGAFSWSANSSSGTQWTDLTEDTTATANAGYIANSPTQVSITLPASAELSTGDIIQVSGIGSGGWKIQQNDGQTILLGNSSILIEGEVGETWTARDSKRSWNSVASSSDGTKLVAVVDGGNIYTSTDSGETWTARMTNSNQDWISVASSSDGTKLVAVVYAGNIYTSTDSGETWTARDSNRIWNSVASSSDGTKLVAVVNGGKIYTSIDSGETWTARESIRQWYSVASSSDGTKLVAVVYDGNIYTSTDSGETWTERESSRSWYSVASSSDGTKLVAVVIGGNIYTSTDSGETWTARDNNRNWISVASSSDGTKLVGVVLGGKIYTSTDSGETWTERMSDRNRTWWSVASSSDGKKLVAGIYGGKIYTSELSVTSVTQTTTGTEGYITGSQNENVTLQYIDNGEFVALEYTGADSETIEHNLEVGGIITADSASLTNLTVSGESLQISNITLVSATTPQTITLPDISGIVVVTEDGTVNTSVADGSITAEKLADGAVTYSKISGGKSGEVLSTDSNGNTIWQEISQGISTGSITAEADTNITLTTSGSGKVLVSGETLQISNTTLVSATTPQTITLPDASGIVVVTEDGTVSASVADGSITAEKLADGSITAAKIADGTITPDELSGSIGNGTSGQVLTADGSGSFTWTSSSSSGTQWTDLAVDTTATANAGYIANSSSQISIMLPDSAGLNAGDIIQVSGVGTGGWKILQNDGQTILLGNSSIELAEAAGVNWTERTTDRAWSSVASSSDGTKLVAVVRDGKIYTSVDSGANWTERATDQSWNSVASSSDGTKLVAVVNGGKIYTSVDSGANWTERATDQNWNSVASSSDGTKLVAVVIGGKIYTSVDSGANWTERATDRGWSSVASSSDGTKLVAVVIGGKIYTSVDSGANWTERATDRNWSSVASSSDGTKLVAVVIGGGKIYTSDDSGASWTERATEQDWISVASSSDGTKLVAIADTCKIYTSDDSGATWTEGGTEQNWISVASSSDGTKLVAVALGGKIYTGEASSPYITQTATGTEGYITGSQNENITLQYIGNGEFVALEYGGADKETIGHDLEVGGTVAATSLQISKTTLVSTATSAQTITLPDASGIVVVTEDGTVSASVADGSITAEKLADGSITSEKLADGAVTYSKITGGESGKVLLTDADGNASWEYVKNEIESFVVDSGETISAGDIVQFVDGKIQKGIGVPATDPSFAGEYTFNSNKTNPYFSVSRLNDNSFVTAYMGEELYGKAVIGTVSGTGEQASISWSGEYTFNSAYSYYISVSRLSDTSFVIGYTDGGDNNNYGNVIIGTVSGTGEQASISWGSEYTLNGSTNSSCISLSHLSEISFVAAYIFELNGRARIGTVSGTGEQTSISWGSEYTLYSGYTSDISVSRLSDTSFVTAYIKGGGNTNSIKARIGTASGSGSGASISWGSEYTLRSAEETDYNSVSRLSDTSFVAAYIDRKNYTDYGKARIGTVSGTEEQASISWGSEYTFNSASTDHISVSRLSDTSFVVAYRDRNNSTDYGKARIGAVSGTGEQASINWGSEYTFQSTSTSYISMSSLSDTSFIAAYNVIMGMNGDLSYGKAIIGRVDGQEIYPVEIADSVGSQEIYPIGIAINSGTNDNNVQVAFSGVVSGLSGLSTGVKYYADDSGNLTSTVTDRYIGVALSETELLIQTDAPGAAAETFDGSAYIQKSGDTITGSLTIEENLEVAGTVKIVDGTQGDGKVLVSDENGVASWQEISSGGEVLVSGETLQISNTMLVSTASSSQSITLTDDGISVESSKAFYFGDPAIDGTWRIVRDDDGNLSFQRSVNGNWKTKLIVE
ncbi:hypothetical protein GMMP15_1270001 [Candidatus Magnetomoraceae bacterium gMMP-15]